MKCFVVVISCLAAVTFAQDFSFVMQAGCEPFWGKNNIVGGQQPYFEASVTGAVGAQVAVVVVEYSDKKFIGSFANGTRQASVCSTYALNMSYCREDQLGKFIVEDPSDIRYPIPGSNRYTDIDTRAVTLTSPTNSSTGSYQFIYNVQKIGYYCVMFSPLVDPEFDVAVDVKIHQPYGTLVGERYPLWPFYGVLSLTYLVIGVLWLGKSAMHWRDILPVQNWIAGVVFVLMLDNSFYFGFYDNWNSTGKYSRGLLLMTVLVNAARNAISLFCLLIVSLGYGVVKPSLGTQMRKCIVMGVVLFFAFVLFDTGSQLIGRDDVSDLFKALFVIFPLAFSMTTVLSWILTGINQTLKHLQSRRQTYKIGMYRKLRWILIVSTVLVVLGIVVSLGVLSNMTSEKWFASNWTSIWFYQEGWMNLLYFFTFFAIALLWRPTDNNVRYGLEELPESAEAAHDLEMNNVLERGLAVDLQATQRRTHSNDDTEPQHVSNANDVIFEIASSSEDEPESPVRKQQEKSSQKDRTGVFTIDEDPVYSEEEDDKLN